MRGFGFKSTVKLALPAACAIALSAAARADDPWHGAYVNLGGGVSLQNTLGATESPVIGTPGTHQWHFNTGESALFGVGWQFSHGLRLEVDTDYLTNQISSVSGYGPGLRAGGHESKTGGLVNLFYDLHLGLPVTPYVGVGLGGTILQHDHVNISDKGYIFPGRLEGQNTGDLTYTGVVGLAYPVTALPGLSMTAEYRFLGQLDPQQSIRYGSYGSSATPLSTGSLRFSNDYNHAIMLGLRFELFSAHSFDVPTVPDVPSGPADAVPPPVQPPVHTYLVFFDWDRADLTSRARQIVAEAANASTQVQTTRIDVNGYTDQSGGSAYNKRLSLRRAETVQAELVRDGVPREEIEIQGYGDSKPLVPTAKGVREPQNRRVEIILH